MTHEKLHSAHEETEPVIWPETMWPLEPSILQGIPDELLPEGEEMRGLQYPWEFLVLMRAMMKARITETRGIEDAEIVRPDLTVLEGPIWFAEGAKIQAFTAIEGPAYVGRRAHIGHGSLVRNCLLLPESFLGAYTEAKGSILGSRSRMAHRNSGLDSILGSGVQFAGMTATANFIDEHTTVRVKVNTGNVEERIDTGLTHFGTVIGSGTTFFANCLTNPGKLVGAGCIIDQNVTVSSNIPDNMRVTNPIIPVTTTPIQEG